MGAGSVQWGTVSDWVGIALTAVLVLVTLYYAWVTRRALATSEAAVAQARRQNDIAELQRRDALGVRWDLVRCQYLDDSGGRRVLIALANRGGGTPHDVTCQASSGKLASGLERWIVTRVSASDGLGFPADHFFVGTGFAARPQQATIEVQYRDMVFGEGEAFTRTFDDVTVT